MPNLFTQSLPFCDLFRSKFKNKKKANKIVGHNDCLLKKPPLEKYVD